MRPVPSGTTYPVRHGYDTENRLATVSNDVFTVAYACTPDGWESGYDIALTNGTVLTRSVIRDPYRRNLIAAVSNAAPSGIISQYSYEYDALARIIQRNNDSFNYNIRSEITIANIHSGHSSGYNYDDIGNLLESSLDNSSTLYSANSLNQYTNISNSAILEPAYDLDGNMVEHGAWSYRYDAENHLITAYSNATLVVSNAYDHQSRRVLKITPDATHTFIYDGWNLIQETVSTTSSTITNHYIWGKDLSGSLQGAGGVGGLLAVIQSGTGGSPVVFFPFYDNNGNITAYDDETGTIVAEYTYDAFGMSIAQTGTMVNAFKFRFSTKYYDSEIGTYYFGKRFFKPEYKRWLNRDPLQEKGGYNQYAYVENQPLVYIDIIGGQPMPGSKPYPLLEFKDYVDWRYEVQYRWGVWVSRQYRAVAQTLPGDAPSRRYLSDGQSSQNDRCLWKSRKITVWAEPKLGWSGSESSSFYPIDSDNRLRYEPRIAIVKSGESPEGKWQPTWSQPGALQVVGLNATTTGPRLTFVNYLWPESTKNIELEIHRRIDRHYLSPYNYVDDDDWSEELPILKFKLLNLIGQALPAPIKGKK